MSATVKMIGPEATDPDRLRLLWLSVLVENVNIALGFGAKDSMSLREQAERTRDEAREWIGSDDFNMVCEFVGIEPVVLLVHISALREAGLPFEVEVWG